MKREMVTPAGITQAMFGHRPDCDAPSRNSINTLMSELRVKARYAGIAIENVRGEGWRLTSDGKARARELGLAA